jgi:putative beta-lysine N-acetyltransferase
MTDIIEKIGFGTYIQHGKLNDRIYLMKLNKSDFPEILDDIFALAKKNNYTKIFCKVPQWAAAFLYSKGFIVEAQIPRFYNNSEDVFFMSKFQPGRLLNPEHEMLEKLSQQLLNINKVPRAIEIPSGFNLIRLKKENAEMIAKVYQDVFESYPFPIFDPEYIVKTMDENVQYYGIETKGKLIGLSSAEIDKKGQNAEMTDFATLPEFRGQKLAYMLLLKMEKEMQLQEISTVYTIARLNSLAMNKTFQNASYKYSGTLIHNTNISGKIESMNVYYKHLEINNGLL